MSRPESQPADVGIDTDNTMMIKSHLNECPLASVEKIKKLIRLFPDKSCELDPIPTGLLKSCLNVLLPFLTKIINKSLEIAHVPTV